MSGGGTNTTTTQSNSEPWGAAQPYLKDNFELTNQLGPEFFETYQGSTVVPHSQQTQSGMDFMQSIAAKHMGTTGYGQNPSPLPYFPSPQDPTPHPRNPGPTFGPNPSLPPELSAPQPFNPSQNPSPQPYFPSPQDPTPLPAPVPNDPTPLPTPVPGDPTPHPTPVQPGPTFGPNPNLPPELSAPTPFNPLPDGITPQPTPVTPRPDGLPYFPSDPRATFGPTPDLPPGLDAPMGRDDEERPFPQPQPSPQPAPAPTPQPSPRGPNPQIDGLPYFPTPEPAPTPLPGDPTPGMPSGPTTTDLYNDAINRRGFANQEQSQSANQMGAISAGMHDVGTDAFSQVVNQSFGPSYSEQNLADIASGQQIGSSNPYFEDALRIASERTADAVNLGASSSGRYGSGAHTARLAREIGDMQTTARAGQVNQDLNRMMGANQQMDSNRFNGLNTALSGANARASTEFQNVGNRMNASANRFNMGQQGFNNIGAAYQGQMAPAQTMMQIGSMYDDLMGRQINDQIRLAESDKNAAKDAIMFRNAIYGGGGALGGSSTQTAQTPGANPFLTGLGAASTGLGLLGGFF